MALISGEGFAYGLSPAQSLSLDLTAQTTPFFQGSQTRWLNSKPALYNSHL